MGNKGIEYPVSSMAKMPHGKCRGVVFEQRCSMSHHLTGSLFEHILSSL